MINKYMNHTKWVINAIKEHNKILKQEIKDRLKNNSFYGNSNFNNFVNCYTTTYKLIVNIDELLCKFIKEGTLNKYNINNVYNVYFKRVCVTFEDCIRFLKISKIELFSLSLSFDFLFYELRQISELIKLSQVNLLKI